MKFHSNPGKKRLPHALFGMQVNPLLLVLSMVITFGSLAAWGWTLRIVSYNIDCADQSSIHGWFKGKSAAG